MKKVSLTAGISFLLGVCCVIAYNVKGSSIAPDGTLVESFGFIPLGWFFFFLAFIFGLAAGIMFLLRLLREKQK